MHSDLRASAHSSESEESLAAERMDMDDAGGVMDDGAEAQQLRSRQSNVMDGEIASQSTEPVQAYNAGTTETISWAISNFPRMREKDYSEVKYAGGYPWRILVFPHGNAPRKSDGPQSVSLFLDAFSEGDVSPGWMRKASFKLRIRNLQEPSKSIEMSSTHIFTSEESDWGFNQFARRDDLLDDTKGFLGDNSTLHVECDITIRDGDVNDPRKETGHIGLKNQGATCYMNSLLHTLFLLPFFRKAVYHMPTTERDEPNNSIPLALQSLFYKLQVSDASVPTRELTKSFGWDTADMFMQHDVQEFNRILFDKLEERMKSTPVEGTIEKLFAGTMVNYIECLDVDYKSSSKETFLDLQLNVKGCKNIYDSLDVYTAEDKLEGDNKYYAEGHGYTDAKKGTVFEKFPPVLELHLKRFDYDFLRDINVKINSRYEFPDVLDLDAFNGKYLAPTADPNVRNKYLLHSVLVHSGGVHGGHYYAFIRPDLHEDGEWFKFDDERVTRESKEAAIEQQYGTDEDPMAQGGTLQQRLNKVSNAYMLVYVRESDREMIRTTVSDEDIAEHIREKHRKEMREKERFRKEKIEAKSNHLLKIASEKDFASHIGGTCAFDLVDFDELPGYKIRNDSPFNTVKEEVAKYVGIPAERQRYWTFARRENATLRPSNMLTKMEEEEAVRNIQKDTAVKGPLQPPEVKLFVEEVNEDEAQPPRSISSTEMMVFIKVYNPRPQTGSRKLWYGGKLHVKRHGKIGEYLDKLSMLSNYDKGAEEISKFRISSERSAHDRDIASTAYATSADDIAVKEEIKFHERVLCEALKMEDTFDNQQLENGDIICVQQKSVAETEDDVKNYFVYEKERVPVVFHPLNEDSAQMEQALDFRAQHNYDFVTSALAQTLGVSNGEHIRLSLPPPQTYGPARPLPYRGFNVLGDLVGQASRKGLIFLYEVLSIPLYELEQLKILPLCYFNRNLEEKAVREYRLDKTLKVPDLLAEAAKDLQLSGKLRLMGVSQNTIYKVYTNETLDQVDTTYGYLRLEEKEVGEEEDGGMCVNVYFAKRDDDGKAIVRYFGEPFIIKLGPTEELSSVRRRIQDKLRVADNEIKQWKFFALMNNQMSDLDDRSIVAEHFTVQGNLLTAWDNPLCIEPPKAPMRSTRADTYPGQAKQLRIS